MEKMSKNNSLRVHRINFATEAEQIEFVLARFSNIKHIVNQTPNIQVAAFERFLISKNLAQASVKRHRISAVGADNEIRSSLKILQYLNKPTKEIQLKFLKENTFAIRYIKNPDINVQYFILNNAPHYLVHIKQPLPEIQLKYAAHDPWNTITIWDSITEEAWDIVYNIMNNADTKFPADVMRLYDKAPDEARKVLTKMTFGSMIPT